MYFEASIRGPIVENVSLIVLEILFSIKHSVSDYFYLGNRKCSCEESQVNGTGS